MAGKIIVKLDKELISRIREGSRRLGIREDQVIAKALQDITPEHIARKINYPRVICGLIYIGISAFLFIRYYKQFYYIDVDDHIMKSIQSVDSNDYRYYLNLYNFYRLIWCFVVTSFAFGIVAINPRYHRRSPLTEYIYYYPPVLIGISILAFSVCHLFETSTRIMWLLFKNPTRISYNDMI
jgi:glucan phosphoethanolaminetransferase (alkaline phosphatase superfamily)